jgi:hypothetical protein
LLFESRENRGAGRSRVNAVRKPIEGKVEEPVESCRVDYRAIRRLDNGARAVEELREAGHRLVAEFPMASSGFHAKLLASDGLNFGPFLARTRV